MKVNFNYLLSRQGNQDSDEPREDDGAKECRRKRPRGISGGSGCSRGISQFRTLGEGDEEEEEEEEEGFEPS
jgi:hypothetical protein